MRTNIKIFPLLTCHHHHHRLYHPTLFHHQKLHQLHHWKFQPKHPIDHWDRNWPRRCDNWMIPYFGISYNTSRNYPYKTINGGPVCFNRTKPIGWWRNRWPGFDLEKMIYKPIWTTSVRWMPRPWDHWGSWKSIMSLYYTTSFMKNNDAPNGSLRRREN